MRRQVVSTALLCIACVADRNSEQNRCPTGAQEGLLGSCTEGVVDAGDLGCDGIALFDGLNARWTSGANDTATLDVAWTFAFAFGFPGAYFDEVALAPETAPAAAGFVSRLSAEEAFLRVELGRSAAFLAAPRSLVVAFADPRSFGFCTHPGMDDRHRVTLTTRFDEASAGAVVVDAEWKVEPGAI